MVFQKKSFPKSKQQTPAKSKKKALEENDLDDMGMDFDDSDDSENGQVAKKTPSKTPKGKQFQNDKRVSFQIPGKNTPAEKTPKNALANKKQATPAKVGSLKEFQGMLSNSAKKNGKAKQAVDEDDDDDDEDDDDDDDDDDEDADLDMMLGDDDDDDEDDDDDDDDDDDEDDDDEEEEEEEDEPKNKKQNVKQQNQSKTVIKKEPEGQNKTPSKGIDKTPSKGMEKTPVKSADKMKKTESPKVASPKKTEKKDNTNPAVKNFLELDAQRRKERNRRALYVGNLPNDIAPTELKALSSDIINVNIPQSLKKKRNTFAFLEFASEAKAEENYKILKNKKLRGEPLTIDYAGEKSQNNTPEKSEKPFNLKKLFVPALSPEVSISDVAKLFPKAISITLSTHPTFRNASILFLSEEDAADALETNKSVKLAGQTVTVMYSIQRDGHAKKRKRSRGHKRMNDKSAKKIKIENKQDSDDDDDDDE